MKKFFLNIIILLLLFFLFCIDNTLCKADYLPLYCNEGATGSSYVNFDFFGYVKNKIDSVFKKSNDEVYTVHPDMNNYNYINVKSFGARGDGTTDDTNCIQTAINSASKGHTVYFPKGKYVIGSIFLKSGVNYDFGNSDLICLSDTPLTANGMVKAVTTMKVYKALEKKILVDDANMAETGDLVHVIAKADPFNTFRKYYYKGGLALTQNVDKQKCELNIEKPFLFDIKPEETIVKIVTPWYGKILNIHSATFKQKSSLKYLLRIEYGDSVLVENVNCNMADGYNIIDLIGCYSCVIDSCNLNKTKVHDIGYSYNIMFCACTDCIIKNCNMKTMWHCYTNGGGIGCTVGTKILDCTMLTDGRVPACTEHANGINTFVNNSKIEGLILSCGATVKNCKLLEVHNNKRSEGTCFRFTAQHNDWLFNNYILEDCEIQRTRDFGACVFLIQNGKKKDSVKKLGYVNSIVIKNCKVIDNKRCTLLAYTNSFVDIHKIDISNCNNIFLDVPSNRSVFKQGNHIYKLEIVASRDL